MESRYAIETDQLTKRFGAFVAVDRLTFSVARGEIFGFLGPNGAGKTTTMRMLLSLLAPSAGSATVLGYDTQGEIDEIRRRIGYMSQRFSLYNDLTVGQNLEFFGGTYGLRGARLRQRTSLALEMAGLVGREKTRASTLAGGWRQSLALGCAILHEPELLFLDEPTAGVDPISRLRFWDLLYDLSARGRTIFVTTHYMDEAERCHRLAFVQRGSIIARGTPQEIVRQQFPDRVLDMQVDDLSLGLSAVQGLKGVDASLYGDRIHATGGNLEARRDELIAAVTEGGARVLEMEWVLPSLEDAFIASVQGRQPTLAQEPD